jgi:hypothetical protein
LIEKTQKDFESKPKIELWFKDSYLNKRVFGFKSNDLEFPNQGDLDFETRIKSRILDQGNLNSTQDFEFIFLEIGNLTRNILKYS